MPVVAVLIKALVDVDQRLNACVVIVYNLLLVLDVLHPVLVSGVDIDPWIVDLIDLTIVIQVIVVKVAQRIVQSSWAVVVRAWVARIYRAWG